MMKMSGRVISCCAALLLALTTVSAGQKKLDSINDLKKIYIGPSVPKHSLLLLHWFANRVKMDNNNIMWLTFDPNRGDYGSHHYGNYEEILDPLPRGDITYRYYTVGSLNRELSTQLPPYVVRPRTEYVGRDRDRIVFRVSQQNTGRQASQRIDQVYMTQHYDPSEHLGTPYDPLHTYRITTNLFRQIREFSVGQNRQQLLQLCNRFGSNANVDHIRITWADLASLGLLLFIVLQEKPSSNQRNNRHENRRSHRDDASNSQRNVPRAFRNQDYVAVDIEEHQASRTTEHRQSGVQNNVQPRSRCVCICCICGIAVTLLISVCVIIYLWYKERLR